MWALPEHHHVDGVVGQAGNKRSQGDEDHDGQEEVGTAVGTGAWACTACGVAITNTATAAIGLQIGGTD